MASYHFSAKTINRRSGRSAVAAAAYRAGARLTNSKDGKTHDFSRRHGVIAAFIITPEGSPDWTQDRNELWNQVEAKEKRQDSRTAREFEIALPCEIGDEAREALVRAFCARFQQQFATPCDAAIHLSTESRKNYHAHILMPTRFIGPDGLGAKMTVLDDPKTSGAVIEELRSDFAALTNQALERERVSERVDHRSYARQKVEAVPGRHMGPIRTAIARRMAVAERAARAARHLATRIRLPALRGRPAGAVLGQSAGWHRRGLQAALRASVAAPASAPQIAVAPATAPVLAPAAPAPAPTHKSALNSPLGRSLMARIQAEKQAQKTAQVAPKPQQPFPEPLAVPPPPRRPFVPTIPWPQPVYQQPAEPSSEPDWFPS